MRAKYEIRTFGAFCGAMLGAQTFYSPSIGVTSLERERTATLIAFSGNHRGEIQLKIRRSRVRSIGPTILLQCLEP